MGGGDWCKDCIGYGGEIRACGSYGYMGLVIRFYMLLMQFTSLVATEIQAGAETFELSLHRD